MSHPTCNHERKRERAHTHLKKRVLFKSRSFLMTGRRSEISLNSLR